MAYNKVDLTFRMSAETAARFSKITDEMNLTKEETLAYLLGLYDKAKIERDCRPKKCVTEANLHTCVRPEIKMKVRELAQQYRLSNGQVLAMLLDTHDECPRTDAGAETAAAGQSMDCDLPAATENAMDQLEAAFNMIRSVFLRVASDNGEAASLREQLAESRAETARAKDAYQRKLQNIMSQLQDLA